VFDPEVPNQLKQDGEIRVLCYNVLAESYALPDRINYCPIWALQWEYRKHRLLKEISAYDPDIMCLQEVESEQFRTFFQPEFAARGYSGVFKPKSRHRTMDDYRRVDGCATFYKTEMFSEIQDYTFEFQSIALQKHEAIAANGDSGLNRLMTKDNIALALLLQLNNPTATARARPQKGPFACVLFEISNWILRRALPTKHMYYRNDDNRWRMP
jgi:CCR4-NOT transcription complex subunit 6